MFLQNHFAENWENKSSNEMIDDVDDRTLRSFYQNAVQCGRMPEYGYDKETILRELGVLNGDVLSNAGRVLFSSNRPLVLKMAIFATEHKETFLDIARAEGNIFQLIDAAIGYIIKNRIHALNCSVFFVPDFIE